jgi:hypothetical protein
MNTVWMIEDGEYSDYHVVGVFSSREKAKKICDIINGPPDEDGYLFKDATIRKVSLDPAIHELNEGLNIFHVCMDHSGNIERCSLGKIDSYDVSGSGLRVWERTKAPAYRDKKVSDAINGSVWAKDKDHAIKITNEYRAQSIAMGKCRSYRET